MEGWIQPHIFSNPPGVHKTCSVGEIPDWTMINEIIDVIE